MNCQHCLHFLDSHIANAPRSGLDGTGYCNAAPRFDQRRGEAITSSHLIRGRDACKLLPSRFHEKETKA
jgi:hypothetical protein